jgi:hypothetical protein
LPPIDLIDLPKANIIGVIGVVKHSMRVSSTFVRNNTFAALLIPGILSTPSGDIGHGFGIAAWTAWTSVAGAISTTGVSEC